MATARGCVHTSLAGIVHQDNLLQECVWRAVDDRVDRSQQRAPGLVVEHDDHAGAGKVIWIQLVLAPSEREKNGREDHVLGVVLQSHTHTFMMGAVVCEPPKLEIKPEQRRREERQPSCSDRAADGELQPRQICQRGKEQ